MNEKVAIFIDGGNFYHLVLKKLGLTELDFDFDAFARFLANGRAISEQGKRYYIGTVREREGDLVSKKHMALQTSLFTKLKSSDWEIKTSKLRTRIETITIDKRVEDWERYKKLGVEEFRFTREREKGIDVKMVTDLFVGAIMKTYDTAIVVSSDTDLVPAIDVLRGRFQRKIEYIGFSIPDPKNPKNSTTPILSMIPHTDIQRTLVESDLRTYIRRLML